MTEKTNIEGVFTIHQDTFKDNRGTIHEIFKQFEVNTRLGFTSQQITHTRSFPKVLRGLHAQGWDRIVYPVNGEIMQVLVDARMGSPTFGVVQQWKINDSNRMALFVPSYVANGYCVLGEEPVDYLYCLDQYYDKKFTKGILYNDPNLKINWGIKDPIISRKDKSNPRFKPL